jgi:hypothetical protein
MGQERFLQTREELVKGCHVARRLSGRFHGFGLSLGEAVQFLASVEALADSWTVDQRSKKQKKSDLHCLIRLSRMALKDRLR